METIIETGPCLRCARVHKKFSKCSVVDVGNGRFYFHCQNCINEEREKINKRILESNDSKNREVDHQ